MIATKEQPVGPAEDAHSPRWDDSSLEFLIESSMVGDDHTRQDPPGEVPQEPTWDSLSSGTQDLMLEGCLDGGSSQEPSGIVEDDHAEGAEDVAKSPSMMEDILGSLSQATTSFLMEGRIEYKEDDDLGKEDDLEDDLVDRGSGRQLLVEDERQEVPETGFEDTTPSEVIPHKPGSSPPEKEYTGEDDPDNSPPIPTLGRVRSGLLTEASPAGKAAGATKNTLGEYKYNLISGGERLADIASVLVEDDHRPLPGLEYHGSTLGEEDDRDDQPILTPGKEYLRGKQGSCTPATPEASIGNYFKKFPDKQSTPVITNFLSLAKSGPRDDIDTRNHPLTTPVTRKPTTTTTTPPPPTLDGQTDARTTGVSPPPRKLMQ